MRKLFLSILSIIIISSFCVATGFQNVNAANNEVSKPQSNVAVSYTHLTLPTSDLV